MHDSTMNIGFDDMRLHAKNVVTTANAIASNNIGTMTNGLPTFNATYPTCHFPKKLDTSMP